MSDDQPRPEGVEAATSWLREHERRGTLGTRIAMLAIPFVLLVIVAGLCVATTGPLGL